MIRTNAATEPRSGLVLLGVLIIIVILSLAAYQYSEMMTAEYAAMANYARTTQTRALVDSGVHFTAAMLADPFNIAGQLGNNPYDNAASFRDVQVSEDPRSGRRGMFSIISIPRAEDRLTGSGQPYRFGVEDENAKLNLNALMQYDAKGEVGYAMLLKLPGMTEDIANAIIDWLDPDETPRAGGAENETYSSMSPSYRCKNGPLDSLEELLLVKGVTPYLLFGNDRNRNGVLDADEGSALGSNGGIDIGWQQYLTVFSTERNLDSYGEARIFLNDQNQFSLWGQLDTALPDNRSVKVFIMAYRLYGAQQVPEGEEMPPEPPADQLEAVQGLVEASFGLGKRARNTIPTIWDLLYKKVTVTSRLLPSGGITLPSPFADPEVARAVLPILFDKFTTRKSADLTPRINVATASTTVLSMLPNLTEEEYLAIQSMQPQYGDGSTPDSIYTSPAWLYTEAQMKPRALKRLDKYITSHSQVYRFQVVGYFDTPGSVSRAEAVIDGNNGRPRVVYWRDLTELGPGFPLGGNVPVP